MSEHDGSGDPLTLPLALSPQGTELSRSPCFFGGSHCCLGGPMLQETRWSPFRVTVFPVATTFRWSLVKLVQLLLRRLHWGKDPAPEPLNQRLFNLPLSFGIIRRPSVAAALLVLIHDGIRQSWYTHPSFSESISLQRVGNIYRNVYIGMFPPAPWLDSCGVPLASSCRHPIVQL